MNNNSGRIWPYAIGMSIVVIFGACVATIAVASKLPVQKSDTYMMDYHEADAKANDILKAAIDFNKKYKIEHLDSSLKIKDGFISYKISDVDSKPINNADINIVVTRPNTHLYDIELKEPVIDNGIYTFGIKELPKEGRWDIMAKVKVGDLERFYNIKADTRAKEITEY